MVDVKHILLTNEEIENCRVFSRNSAPNQQSIEFGQHSTTARSTYEIARDNLIGKMAEVAFKKMMLENYGIDIPLDFNYYPRGKWDDQDAVINGWRIDIKGTRRGGRWLLIEWNKLCFRQKDNNLSHVYMMFTVDWDRTTDTPTGVVSYEGAVSLAKLNSTCEKTKTLLKDTVLPGTNTKLQADNYGIHFNDLYKHLNHMIDYITHNSPPDTITNNFINPYSGQTTKELAHDHHCVVTDEANMEIPISQHSKNQLSAFLEKIRGVFRWF